MLLEKPSVVLFLWFCGGSAALEVTSTSGRGRVVVREDSDFAILSCSSDSHEETTCTWILPQTEEGVARRCSWLKGSPKQCRSAPNVWFNGTSGLCQVRVSRVQEDQNGAWTCEIGSGEEQATAQVELYVAMEPEVDWIGAYFSGSTIKLVKGEEKTLGCEALEARPSGDFIFHWGYDHTQGNIAASDQVVNQQMSGAEDVNRTVTIVPDFDMDKKTLFCTFLQVDGEGNTVYKTQAQLDIEVFALDIGPETEAQKIGKTGENVTFSVHFTSSPPPEEGDMTWVVQLPEGSRPSKHEIQVPEGEGEGKWIAGRYLVHPLHTVSRHNYRVELTVINVTKADEENVHSLKITKRVGSGNSIEREQKFSLFVDRAPIPDESTSIVLIIVIVVIIVLVVVITGAMLVVYAKKNEKWCYSSSRKAYINPDTTERKEPLVQHHPYGRPSAN